MLNLLPQYQSLGRKKKKEQEEKEEERRKGKGVLSTKALVPEADVQPGVLCSPLSSPA